MPVDIIDEKFLVKVKTSYNYSFDLFFYIALLYNFHFISLEKHYILSIFFYCKLINLQYFSLPSIVSLSVTDILSRVLVVSRCTFTAEYFINDVFALRNIIQFDIPRTKKKVEEPICCISSCPYRVFFNVIHSNNNWLQHIFLPIFPLAQKREQKLHNKKLTTQQ